MNKATELKINLKVPIEQLMDRDSYVAYCSIPCKDCGKTYVGQSCQSLTCRLKEH